jgi:hypothetical protein
MKPNVFSVTSAEALEMQLETIHQQGLSPRLAIVFCSVDHDMQALGQIFAKHDISVFGASTMGEILNDGAQEESIVVMLLDIDPAFFRLKAFEADEESSRQTGQKVADWAKAAFDNPAFMIVAAGPSFYSEPFIDGIITGMQRQVPLFGGLAGNNTYGDETYVFTSSRVLMAGAVVLIIDQDEFVVQGVAASGWKGIGTAKTITKAEGNIVYEIDGEPTVDIFNKYLNIGDDFMLAAEYPLQLIREDGSTVLRGFVSVQEDKSIIFNASLPEGSKVRFSMPPGFDVVEHALEKITDFRSLTTEADAIVLFSCAIRHMALGPMVEEEIAGIRKLWNVPMIGFFTFGEIGPLPQGRCEFHGYTLVPVILKKK